MEHLRDVDVTVAPADAASITARAESIYTLAGSGSVAVVAGVGLRATCGTASGDSVLVQTPERPRGGESVESSLTVLLAGDQGDRRAELGFIDGDAGAFWRIDDGVVRMVVSRSSGVELVSVPDVTVDLTRVHTWAVRLTRRSAEFFLDGESYGAIEATTAALTERLEHRAAFRFVNDAAAVGSATCTVQSWKLLVDGLAAPAWIGNAAAAQTLIAKAEGGRVLFVHATTDSASLRYLMIFDKATAPIDTDVPALTVAIPAGLRSVSVRLDAPGLRLARGVSVALSTTVGTLTLPSAEGFYEVAYT